MLKAIIFDCDGVIADTEPLHLAAFQKVLDEESIALTEDEYFSRYLALDDRGCFTMAYADRGKSLAEEKLDELVRRKADYIEPVMQNHLRIFPGVTEFIRQAAGKYSLAVASGALRQEVELILEHGRVRDCFPVVVSAEDVSRSKPHPDPFIKAIELVNAGRAERIMPRECLVIEDSIHGVEAAHRAGMSCLAVTNTYGEEQLPEAERVVESLEGLRLEELEKLFASE